MHSVLSARPALTLLTLVLLASFLLPAGAQAARHRQAPPAEEAVEPDVPTMLVSNRSHHDLVALRINDGSTTSFARMDLYPGSEDEIENPGGTVELRLDLGLQLCTWDRVNLTGVRSIALCSDHEGCLVVDRGDGSAPVHTRGACTSLLPREGAMPVCTLEGFHSGMTMKEACGLINTYYTMETDVYLATVGFANIAWSARLYADTGNVKNVGDAVLENVELRQQISVPNIRAVQMALKRLDYVPWQASFPGIELTFTDMRNLSEKKRQELLELCVSAFLTEGRGTGSVTYVPLRLLEALKAPEVAGLDTQLYTLSLHRDSDTMVLDMSAYTVDAQR